MVLKTRSDKEKMRFDVCVGCKHERAVCTPLLSDYNEDSLWLIGTVKPLLADTPNSGHLLYSRQCAM